MKTYFFPILFVLLCARLSAQVKNELLQQRIEFIAEQLNTEEVDLTAIFEQLNEFGMHPLNLNFADETALKSMGLLTEFQVNNILLHRQLFGKFISIYELQSLEYLDLQTIQLILPFIKVDDKLDNLHVSLKEIMRFGTFEGLARFQTMGESKAGYASIADSIKKMSNNYYYGNQGHYYTRLKFNYRTNISLGITGEKDPGEQFFKGAQKNGFDFYSFHAFYKGGKYLKSVALGDYQVQVGQGLNLWSGYAFGKTADVTNVKKTASSIRPYTSVDEVRFLRGAAMELAYKKFTFIGFYSQKQVDANSVYDSINQDIGFVSSINFAGLHRTTSELENRKSLTEQVGGGNLRYQSRRFNIGSALVYQGYQTIYNKPILPYNQFDFRGTGFVSWSGDYSFVWKNACFFGEVATASFSKAVAQIHGVLLALDPTVSLSLVYRNYNKAYQTFYNAGFSEGSATQNEKGIYVGLKTKLKGPWSAQAYADFFQSDGLKYQVDAPSKGHELLFQLTYKPTKQLEIYGRYRNQVRQKNSRDSDGTLTEIEPVNQQNLRLNLSYNVSDEITLKSRIEAVFINRPSNQPEKGMLLTQDVLYKLKSSPIDLTLRFALFETDSYDSRLYSFENNALNVFSIPACYYQGSRAYLLLHATLFKKLDCWFRYGAFIYNNRKTLGSGAEEINGSVKSDVTIQLRFKIN
ncbi:MAG: hypothetical protein KA521_04415 [Crocinitomicaceae bacterium]|nr:hypothetical protein [Crocinitomicaceae bacterium]